MPETMQQLLRERGAKVVVLPASPFGVQTGQLDIRLCINLNPSTQAAINGPTLPGSMTFSSTSCSE